MATFKAWVKQNIASLSVKEYNTNNGWGFGGSYGKEYTLPDGKTFVRIGTACTRHAGTYYCEYAGVYTGEDRLFIASKFSFDEFLALDSEAKCGKLTV